MKIKYFSDLHTEQKQHEQGLVSELFDDKIMVLKASIKLLDEDIIKRNSLSKQLISEIQAKKRKLEFDVSELKGWWHGYNRGLDQHRGNLHKDIFNLDREDRNERQRCLRDITNLEHKQREKIEEYMGLMALNRE